MSFIAVTNALQDLKTKLTALQTGSPAAAMFATVELSQDDEDIGRALREIVDARNRICLVVPIDVTFRTDRSGQGRTVMRKFLEVLLIISDVARHPADRKNALFGGGAKPGLILLQDEIVDALGGSDLDRPGLLVAPGEGVPAKLHDPKEKDRPPREAWLQTLELELGYKAVKQGRAAGPPV